MTRAWLVVFAIGCGSSKAKPPAEYRVPVPQPQADEDAFVPPRPTLRLPTHFTPTRYTARLAIDPAKPTFDGEIKIDGNLDRRSAVIWLHGKHLDVTSAKASDGTHEISIDVKADGDLLELRASHPLDAGHWTLSLVYHGQVQQDGVDGAYMSKYGTDRYVTTQFEAIAARLVFPCIDEPNRKTPWQLTLDVPKGQVAVSNTMPTGTVALDPTHERIAFAVTRPLPSYLVAFGVGPFEVVDAGKAKSGVALRVITPKGTTKKVAFLASAMPRMVDSLETWFGIPYPYPKLDVVAVPAMAGAMENAGLITTDSKAVMFDNPGPRDRYQCVSIIGHETAHQWFGDLVTAAWWDDIWLNESFATWIEDKVLLAYDKTWPAEAIQHRQFGFAADSPISARKIRQPIEAIGDIQNAFDNVTYPKGGTVLRMIEHQLGETAFQNAIRHYLLAHADGNATAADLFTALDGDKPLGELVTSWFDQPGVPEVAMKLSCDGGTAKIALSQQRFLPTPAPNDQHWTIPVCVVYEGAKHERVEQCTVLAKSEGELALPVCPAWFAPAGDYGYFHAKLEVKALEAIRDKAWKALTVDEHIAIYTDAYVFTLQGALPFALWGTLTTKLGHSSDLRELAASLGDVAGIGGGVRGLPDMFIHATPKELLPVARAKVRAIAEPLIKKYGLVPAANDTVQIANLRSDVIGVIEWSRSHVVDAQAKQQLPHYRDLSNDTMTAVFDLAANADPKIAAQLHTQLSAEVDPLTRAALLSTLEGLRDPVQHHKMLEALATDTTLTADERARIWVGFNFGDEEQRADDEAYERTHLEAVMKTLPHSENEIFPLAVLAMYPFVLACDPSRRDEIASYVTAHFATLPAASRPVKEAIEEMDDCIAHEKLLEPSVRAWLTGKP